MWEYTFAFKGLERFLGTLDLLREEQPIPLENDVTDVLHRQHWVLAKDFEDHLLHMSFAELLLLM